MIRLFGKKTQQVRLSIRGMTCHHCTATAQRQLESLPGVTKARVSLDQGMAEVTYRPDRTSPSQIVDGFNRISTYRAEMT